MIQRMPDSVEVIHERLKAFLLHLKPFLLGGGVDQDRLSQLCRLLFNTNEFVEVD